MNRFVIAIRRSARNTGASLNVVQPSASVKIVEPEFQGVMVIEADELSVSHLQHRYGDKLIIEPEITMSPLSHGRRIG